MTKFQGKNRNNGIFTHCQKIDSLRLTISLNICFQNDSPRRSISPVWWLRSATLVPLAVAFTWRPFPDNAGPEKHCI